MNTRYFSGLCLIAVSAVVGCTKGDMSDYDKYFAEKFNQELKWNADSLAFIYTKWESNELKDGLTVNTATVKLESSRQLVSYVKYDPMAFNTVVGHTGTEGELSAVASAHETAVLAVGVGNTGG